MLNSFSAQKKHVVVVIPTYNEKENIELLLPTILSVRKQLGRNAKLSILVVDDCSPDGTGKAVEEFARLRRDVHLIYGKKAGLGVAYIRGYTYALTVLKADVVVQMDADFSHDPKDIPRLIRQMRYGANFVIASRYTPGGTIPKNWPFYRVLISKLGNIVARTVAGLSKVKDCTNGFRAIHAHLLKEMNISQIGATGYSFQMNMLFTALIKNATVAEVPVHFEDRVAGKSKMRMYDILEFIVNAFVLRVKKVSNGLRLYKYKKIVEYTLLGFAAILLGYALLTGALALKTVGITLFILISIAITLQSAFILFGMMYAWERPERVQENRSPSDYERPDYSFTAIVPAYKEEAVIADTIRAVAGIDYPESKKEILIVLRPDDTGTISKAREAIDQLGKENVRLVIPNYIPKNKPEKLNIALEQASNDIVCVFDAEDAPHKDIFRIVNTVLIRDHADVVQSGVQLMNFRSNWFSTLNVLEYFFWFKSVLHFFASHHVIPLGGNTVFIKRHWLKRVGGWDPNCLTEDADLGIKLSSAHANIRIIYDELHATQEETPPTLGSFIKQRTRWNQGFLQVYKKKEWKKLPTFFQKFLVLYILLWPEIQAMLFLYSIVAIIMMFTVKVPVTLALLSLIPMYILLTHFIVLCVGMYEFTKKYDFPYAKIMLPIRLFISFIPFQLVLGVSALRAVYRELTNKQGWEKTEHHNVHRLAPGKPTVTLRS